MRSHALCALLAAAGFFGTASALRPLVPWPDRGTIRDKLTHYFEHGDRYDVVLFGTSRVLAGLDPRVMEAELSRQGHEWRVFNLGLPAVGAFEVDYYLRRIVERDFERLQLVLVEAWWGPPIALDRNAFTERRVEWHTARQTVAAARAALAEPDWSPTERLRQAHGHVVHFAWRLAGHGRGPAMLDALLDGGTTDSGEVDGQGYRAWTPGAGRRDGEGRGREVSWARPASKGASERVAHGLALYEEQAALARAHGLRVVHVLAPGFREPFPVGALRRRVDTLLDYRPPRPEREDALPHLAFLNDPELRVDAEHLTPEGTRRLSRLVAADLARLADEER